MKLSSNKFVIIVYQISVGLVAFQYLVLMGVINMLLKTVSAGLSIAVPVLIIQVFHMTKRAHTCCLRLLYSAPAFLIIVISYTIM